MYDQSGNLHFYLNDHLGSARVVIDSTGTVKDAYKRYYAFGDAAQQTVSTGQRYRYTGKPFDDEGAFDLYYYGARYYDPKLGRFIAVDPLAGKYPSWSPYAYTLDNPMKFIDPNGMGEQQSGGQNQAQQPPLSPINQKMIDAEVFVENTVEKTREAALTSLDFVSEQSGYLAIAGMVGCNYSARLTKNPWVPAAFGGLATGAMVTQFGAELGKNVLGEGNLKKTIILGLVAAVSKGSSKGIANLGLDKTGTMVLQNYADVMIWLFGTTAETTIVPETETEDEEEEEVEQP